MLCCVAPQGLRCAEDEHLLATEPTPRSSANSYTSCESTTPHVYNTTSLTSFQSVEAFLPSNYDPLPECHTPLGNMQYDHTEYDQTLLQPWLYSYLDPTMLRLGSKTLQAWPHIECHVSHVSGSPESIRSPLLDTGPVLERWEAKAGRAKLGPRRRVYTLILFAIAAGMPFTAVNLLAPNLSAAAHDFHFTDLQRDQELGGYLMAGFFLVGAPAALAAGYLVDKVNRRDFLFWMLLLSSLPSIATFWVHRYYQLLILRLMVGVSVGSVFPLVFSLMGDLCATEQRSTMSAIIQIAVAVGVATGQLVAGILGPATSWRLPFLVTAIPTLPLAILLRCTTADPQRGCSEAVLAEQYAGCEEWRYEETVSWAKFKQLLAIPSNWLAILQGLPGSLPWGMFLTFFIDYLHREKGLAVQMATTLVLLFGLGGGIGMVVGGFLGQVLYNRGKWLMGFVMGLPVLIGIIPMFALVNCDLQQWGMGLSAFVTILLGVVASMPGPGLRALILNVNEPETRGIAIALHSTMDEVGKGLGPALAAWLITVAGRRRAFNMSMFLGWIPCGLLLLSTMFTIQRDEQAMQERLARVLGSNGVGSGDKQDSLVVVDGDKQEPLLGQEQLDEELGEAEDR